MVVPYGEADYYRARPRSRSRSRAAPMARSISTASSDCIRACRRSSRCGIAGELAIVHAAGSHDTTRSHFDAQDYMESATPGVKSTKDGWLNRYLQGSAFARLRRKSGIGDQGSGGASPLRGVALTKQMPRSLQGTAPALAIGSTERLHRRRHERADVVRRDLRRRAAGPGAARHRRRGVRRHADARPENRGRLSAGERCDVSAIAVRPGAAGDRAAREVGRRPRDRVRREHAVGPSRQRRVRRPGRSPIVSTTSRAASRLLPRTLAIEWPTPSS